MNKFFLILLLAAMQLSAQGKVKVYLLATYHMGGTADAMKVDPAKDNILGSKRQQELDLLLARLAKTNVEKIYVESTPKNQVFWDSIFKLHFTGKKVAMKNEIFQIGIKLAEKLGIRRGVTCVDWWQDEAKSAADKVFADYCRKMNKLGDSLSADDAGQFSNFDRMVIKDLTALNQKIPDMDLLSVYLTLNSDEYLRKFHYANVTTYLDKNTQGLGTFYSQYNSMRNVNIYSNIMQDILEHRPEKVLVLYGAGHIQALKDMFKSHPLIEVVEINTVLAE